MKVLVFPVLLAIAICVSPPKPFTAQAGKEVTARTAAPAEALNTANASASHLPATPPTANKQNLPLLTGEGSTARR